MTRDRQNREPRLPDFFIIGAPKSATTSLASYIQAHPNAFLSEPKEPHYFSEDFSPPQRIRSFTEYQRLFSAASSSHRAVGEASVFYLASEQAVPNIEARVPNAKYIAILRNPVDVVHSLHAMLVLARLESETDFLTAWKLQEVRAQGRMLPRHIREPKLLQYGDIASFGRQIQRLYRIVPQHRILVLSYDDLVADAPALYSRVLAFLGLDQRPHGEFARHNAHREVRNALFQDLLHRVALAAKAVKVRLGIRNDFGVLKPLQRLNTREAKRPPLEPEVREMLQEYFAEDQELLSTVVDRST